MPYILQEKRKLFEQEILSLVQKLKTDKENVEGNLNYIFTKMILLLEPSRYKDMNGIIGALECCKQELYRRHISPYEDQAVQKNGDVLK